MEAHKCIRELVVELAFDRFLVHILRHGVVDVEQSHDIIADCLTDKLTQASVDIYLTGYRNASSCQTAVHKTRNETKLCLECRPALACNSQLV